MFDKRTIDKIRSLSGEIEQKGKLPNFVLDLIYKKKLFKLFIPKELGGLMLPLPETLRIFDEAARIDGNLGWAITIGSGGGYFYAYMQPDTASKVFKDKKTVVAGSGHPSAIAEEIKGGYRVTGQWKYASGAPYASIFTANAIIKSKNKNTPKMLAFAFNPKQVSIIKDWNAFGMKATESHSFKVDKAFVPHEMTFNLSVKPRINEPVYNYPFLQFAEASFAALVIGLGRHFIEESKNILFQNKKVWQDDRYIFVKTKLDEAEKQIQKASNSFYKVVDKSWTQMLKQNKLQATLQQEVSKTSKQTSTTIRKCADELIQYMGMNAIMEDSDINKVWRDLHTACQHILLVPFE